MAAVPMGDLDAATPMPATLTPFPTADWSTVSDAQMTLGRHINDMIWWECASLPIGYIPCYTSSPRPGFALYTVQGYRWLYNMGVLKVLMNGVVAMSVIFIWIRTLRRIQRFFEGDITSVDVSVDVNQLMTEQVKQSQLEHSKFSASGDTASENVIGYFKKLD